MPLSALLTAVILLVRLRPWQDSVSVSTTSFVSVTPPGVTRHEGRPCNSPLEHTLFLKKQTNKLEKYSESPVCQ